jgi:hypothetical protein
MHLWATLDLRRARRTRADPNANPDTHQDDNREN